MSPPDLAVVIGAMKAGTTTLFERLAGHPDVVGSTPKEPQFFSRDERWERGPGWYRDRWPGDLEGRVRLEASPGYTMNPRYPRTFARMRAHLDETGLEARLVYSLRDPIERIRSHLTHWVAAGMDEELFDHRRGTVSGHALATSMYARQLDAFLEHFEASQLQLVRFADLADDTEATLADVAAFLDLAPEALPTGRRVHNPSTGKYDKTRAWRALEVLGLDRLTGLLPGRAREGVRDALGTRIEGKVQLSDAQQEAYLDALEADLARLRDVHGVGLDGWTLPEGL